MKKIYFIKLNTLKDYKKLHLYLLKGYQIVSIDVDKAIIKGRSLYLKYT